MTNTQKRLLEIVMTKMSNNDIDQNITALSRDAGISRSAIYKYYPEVVAAVKRIACGGKPAPITDGLTKLSLLQKKTQLQKITIEHLANICSNQLVEIHELKQSCEMLKAETSARIHYLEGQLAIVRPGSLKIIK